MRLRRRALVALVVVAAGCSAATSPQRSSPAGPSAATTGPGATATPGAVPRRTPRPTPDPNAVELEGAGSLDPSLTAPLLELVSDGTDVIFSSGLADGTHAPAAPDLYRHRPGEDRPELLWRNPARDRNIVKIAGHDGTLAFVDASATGERSWNLWLLPGPGAEAVLLDEHPGDETVTDLVPSFDVNARRVVWTAFDRGVHGTVSELWFAQEPTWEPVLLATREAAGRELWLPSLRGDRLAYVEVVYNADRSGDERHVLLTDLTTPEAEPVRLDRWGRATMPLVTEEAVIWKETQAGFNMFNWGALVHHDIATGEQRSLPMHPQAEVNYPSAGDRYIAAWGVNTRTFTIHDLETEQTKVVARYPPLGEENVLRPHVRGDLLVWLHARIPANGQGPPPEVHWAWLPLPGSSRR